MFLKNLVVYLPTSRGLSLIWNLGSLLGMILMMQIVSGIFLVFYYSVGDPFSSVQYIMVETKYGWAFRVLHFNGASFLFVILYLHIFKALFNQSYRLSLVWFSGLVLFLGFMGTAFLGYTLVWGQMSFWAAVVITSLVSVIPFVGQSIVFWLWGSFLVSKSTIKFFFALHFILPLVLLLVVGSHLILLHSTGSSSSLSMFDGVSKISFYPFYWWKDSLNLLCLAFFGCFIFLYPFLLGDPEMSVEANSMVSPVHIIPEWYFLLFYAVLRAIPNKSLGVIGLLSSLLVFFLFPFSMGIFSKSSLINKSLVSLFILMGVVLSWLGQCPVEFPFVLMSLMGVGLFFLVIFLMLMFNVSVTYNMTNK